MQTVARLAAASALLALLAVAAGPAASARAALVGVYDDSLEPRRVTIVAGERVRWANEGTRAHTVRSNSRAWRAFTVEPRRSRAVRFGRPGRYRYRVDRRLRGVVLVKRPARRAGDGPGGGTGGPRGGRDGKRVFRYGIRLSGEVSTKTTVRPNSGAADSPKGSYSRRIKWSASFKNVNVVAKRLPAASRKRKGPRSVVLGPGRGSVNVQVSYADEVIENAEDDRPACHFGREWRNLAGTVVLTGLEPMRGMRGRVDFGFGLAGGQASPRALALRAIQADCPQRPVGARLTPIFSHRLKKRGIAFDWRGGDLVALSFNREWRKGLALPMNRLYRGRSVTLKTGAVLSSFFQGVLNGPCPAPNEGVCIIDAVTENFTVRFRRR